MLIEADRSLTRAGASHCRMPPQLDRQGNQEAVSSFHKSNALETAQNSASQKKGGWGGGDALLQLLHVKHCQIMPSSP